MRLQGGGTDAARGSNEDDGTGTCSEDDGTVAKTAVDAVARTGIDDDDEVALSDREAAVLLSANGSALGDLDVNKVVEVREGVSDERRERKIFFCGIKQFS
ncbi:hypothetical protein CBOM_01000 [Ceraceosorus bombacis]|uniref:Uncharacterized protein n=1 Tax=Ceraceosorus bombacis TaxID=401625 RepID=A0A0P1BBB6_9BASI|nr:hypothetical protein CBOM_01000 [Ceraceosorus bombacis]